MMGMEAGWYSASMLFSGLRDGCRKGVMDGSDFRDSAIGFGRLESDMVPSFPRFSFASAAPSRPNAAAAFRLLPLD